MPNKFKKQKEKVDGQNIVKIAMYDGDKRLVAQGIPEALEKDNEYLNALKIVMEKEYENSIDNNADPVITDLG